MPKMSAQGILQIGWNRLMGKTIVRAMGRQGRTKTNMQGL